MSLRNLTPNDSLNQTGMSEKAATLLERKELNGFQISSDIV